VNERYGSQSMVAPLRRVLVRRPGETFGEADPDVWHYRSRPDLPAARGEHDALCELLRESGAEVIEHDSPETKSADAIYVHDPCIVTSAGAILLRMGKPLRGDEPGAIAAALEAAGVPVYRTLEGKARAEGGDLLWLDDRTLAVGTGFRTNEEGVRQLEEALDPLGAGVAVVPIPHPADPDACLHLMSFISMIDHDLALVYPPWMPAELRSLLDDRGIATVEVPDSEIESMGPNVLAVGPRDCIALEGNPVTQERLVGAGCRVRTYRGEEISLNAEGGPTCLTRPILRVA